MRVLVALLAILMPAILTMLLLAMPLSAARDEHVDAKLKNVADSAMTNAFTEAEKYRIRIYKAVWTACQDVGQSARERCTRRLLLRLFDSTGMMFERCGPMTDRNAIAACIVAGPEALAIVAALGGDPRTDIDWVHVVDSYTELRVALFEVARSYCGFRAQVLAICMIEKEAELLRLPETVSKYCTQRDWRSMQRCLDDFHMLAIYLRALYNQPDRMRKPL